MRAEDNVIRKVKALTAFKRKLDAFSSQFIIEFNKYSVLHTAEEFDQWLLVISSLLKSFHFNLRDIIKEIDDK